MPGKEHPESAELEFLLQLLDNKLEQEIVTLISGQRTPDEILKVLLRKRPHD